MSELANTTGTWVIDPSHTNIGFSARHAMVAKVRGTFTDFTGTFVLDGEDPSKSSAELTIMTASITTRNDDRDGHLKSADFLDVESFPTLTLTSTSVTANGETFVVTGDMTVHGTTKSVPVTFELMGVSTDPWGGIRIGFEGSTEISRKDFGLTWNTALETGGVLVGDAVKIELDVEAVKS